MTSHANVDPSEGSFYVFGPESGNVYIREAYIGAQAVASAEGAVDLLYRNLELQSALRLFAPMNQLKSFVQQVTKPGRDDLKDRYGSGLSIVATNSEEKLSKLGIEAKNHFARAFGIHEIVEHELVTPKVAQALARDSYNGRTGLKTKFGAARKISEVAREGLLLKLVHQEVVLAANQKPTETLPRPEPITRELTDREKLIALRDSPDAGFLPASNSEKTKALTLLAYINNPEYELGTIMQLQEVFGHQKKVHGVTVGTKLGKDALRSLPLEFGDYLISAVESINNLRNLDQIVGECLNPKISLHEELGELGDTPGVIELIRFIEQRTFRETGENPKDVSFSMFRSHQNRGPQHDEFKHKTVEDAYTAEELAIVVEKHLQRKIKSLTIGDIRNVIPEAIEDQRSRAIFWEARIQETRALVITWRSGHFVLEKVQSMAS
jgi:hypothetical protein